jgi:endonuclease/exonuclease/phosphatase family metal-dependent hydrolase
LNSNGELNGRLTMRDAILAKVGAGVKVKSTDSSNFDTIYQPVISGIPVNVDRGWTSADVKVRKAPKFRFVNTHLEAFGEPTIREAQAKELVAPGGPLANSKKRAILVGDLNSDDDTTFGDDPLAYNALKAAGLKDRGTQKPMSCCVKSDILTADMGSRSDFDHYIDHVMTNQPKKVRKLASSVSGLKPERGYWNSDHAGVFSKLRVKP